MARKSYLQIVNGVLQRLRQPTVGSVSGDYPALIGKLVNDAKAHVEDAWRWNELRTDLTITTVASDKLYSLTDFGERYRIDAVWNDTRNRRVIPASDGYIEKRLMVESDPGGTPEYWRIFSVDSNGDPQIEFYPTPTSAESLHVYATVAQADLSADGTLLTVPYRPVELLAYAMAVSERGEHGGNLYDEVRRQANEELTAAIAQDNLNVARGLTSDWHVE